MLLANFDRKEHLQHRAVSLRQHGFLVCIIVAVFFSIFPSNFIVSASGVSICNQFRIRRPAHVTPSSHRVLDRFKSLMAFPIGALLQPRLCTAVFEIIGTKHIGVTTLIFRVTCRHQPRDHSTRYRPFPIGSPSEPKSPSLTVSEIFCPNLMCCRIVIVHARYHVICTLMQNLIQI